MSAGHHKDLAPQISAVRRDAALASIKDARASKRTLNRSYDLPYLAGYSEDGKTIYIDRHLPKAVKIGKREVDPTPFLECHEEVEKSLIDELGWGYWPSHHVATHEEEAEVRAAGIQTAAYEKALQPFIKADEHEKIVKVPPDLDLTPYYAAPVDKELVRHLRKKMGLPAERERKSDAGYKAGHKGEHCGPDGEFGETGSCLSFLPPHGCKRVSGRIDPDMWCRYFERKAAR